MESDSVSFVGKSIVLPSFKHGPVQPAWLFEVPAGCKAGASDSSAS